MPFSCKWMPRRRVSEALWRMSIGEMNQRKYRDAEKAARVIFGAILRHTIMQIARRNIAMTYRNAYTRNFTRSPTALHLHARLHRWKRIRSGAAIRRTICHERLHMSMATISGITSFGAAKYRMLRLKSKRYRWESTCQRRVSTLLAWRLFITVPCPMPV